MRLLRGELAHDGSGVFGDMQPLDPDSDVPIVEQLRLALGEKLAKVCAPAQPQP